MKNNKIDLFGRKLTARSVAILALIFGFSVNTLAQEPRSTPVGPFELEASVLTEYVEDDNVFQSASEPVSTSIFTVTPSFELTFDNGVSGFSLAYSLEDRTHSDTGDEDYTDQNVLLSLGNIVADMHRFEFNGVYFDSHDARGGLSRTGFDEDLDIDDQGELDLFEDIEYEFVYTLGTEESLFRFQFSLGEFEREYKTNRTNRDIGAENTIRFDREESRVGGEFFWNLSPIFTASISYLKTDIDYLFDETIFRAGTPGNIEPQDIVPQNDGEEELYAIGIEWEPTDTIGAAIIVGSVERTTETVGSERNNYWDIDISWDIRSYSSLSLLSSSVVGETANADGSFTVEETVGFRWTHEWTDLLRSELIYSNGEIEFSGSSRVDDNETIGLRATYEFRPQFIIGLSAERVTRSSAGGATNTEPYDQNVYGISALFRL
ncbi:MAG: hypothetical protein ACRBBR_16555 [Cellvibrionaceae bacterium]